MSRDGAHDNLDEVIDQVAQSLTGGEPSATLRERVRSRIDSTRTSASAVSWRAAVAVAALVLAAFALAPILLDDRSSTEIATDRLQQAQAGPLRPVEMSSDRVDEALRPEPVAARSPTARNGPAEAAIAPGFQMEPPDEPPAPPFPPLSVDQVAIEPLAAIPVAIEEVPVPVPLQVQRLDIAALAME